MGIESGSPKIALLRTKIESHLDKKPEVHNDFVEIAQSICSSIGKYISETTLERVWNYSNRGYQSVSRYTLDILCEFAGFISWDNFCKIIREEGLKDSDMFEDNSICSEDLLEGDRLQFGWLPDRMCTVKYLGNNRFIAETCENSTMQPGDSFSCIEFMLNHPAVMDQFIAADDPDHTPRRYVAGLEHGLSFLKKL